MYGLAIMAYIEALELSNRRDKGPWPQRSDTARRASCARDRLAPLARRPDRR